MNQQRRLLLSSSHRVVSQVIVTAGRRRRGRQPLHSNHYYCHTKSNYYISGISSPLSSICQKREASSSTFRCGGRYYCYYHTSRPILLDDDTTIEVGGGGTHSYYFASKTVMIPHDSKQHRGGEDAAGASKEVLVVADGVGGWASEGVNPANFSRTLVDAILQKVSSSSSSKSTFASKSRLTKSLKELIQEANLQTASQYLGSATCTTIQLLPSTSTISDENDSNTNTTTTTIGCETVNIGDSGYAILRSSIPTTTTTTPEDIDEGDGDDVKKNSSNDSNDSWKLLHVSKVGQKEFNFPNQLGGLQHGDDATKVGITEHHDLHVDDVLILYTDGVSDNLPPQLFDKFLNNPEFVDKTPANDDTGNVAEEENDQNFTDDVSSKRIDLQAIADSIAKTSYLLSKNTNFLSPFAQGARKAGWGPNYNGGKHDDITVMVAQLRHGTHQDQERDNDNNIVMYVGAPKEGENNQDSTPPSSGDKQ